MAKTKQEKKKARRKAKIKSLKKTAGAGLKKGNTRSFLRQYRFYRTIGQDERAAGFLLSASRANPKNGAILGELADLGYDLERDDLLLEGLHGLYRIGKLSKENTHPLCVLLQNHGKCREALQIADEALAQ